MTRHRFVTNAAGTLTLTSTSAQQLIRLAIFVIRSVTFHVCVLPRIDRVTIKTEISGRRYPARTVEKFLEQSDQKNQQRQQPLNNWVIVTTILQ